MLSRSRQSRCSLHGLVCAAALSNPTHSTAFRSKSTWLVRSIPAAPDLHGSSLSSPPMPSINHLSWIPLEGMVSIQRLNLTVGAELLRAPKMPSVNLAWPRSRMDGSHLQMPTVPARSSLIVPALHEVNSEIKRFLERVKQQQGCWSGLLLLSGPALLQILAISPCCCVSMDYI